MKSMEDIKNISEPSLLAYIVVILAIFALTYLGFKTLDYQSKYYIQKYVKKECLK